MSAVQVPVTISAVLTTSSNTNPPNQPIPNEPITFAWSPNQSTPSWTTIGTATTDSTGTASVQFQATLGQSYLFQGVFNGDQTLGYAPSSGISQPFRPTASTSLQVVAKPS
jgi:hypothetical protein